MRFCHNLIVNQKNSLDSEVVRGQPCIVKRDSELGVALDPVKDLEDTEPSFSF